MQDRTPYQRKIIKRYYENFDSIALQRLAETVTEIYLSEGKKRDKLWTQVFGTLERIKFPQGRIDHLKQTQDLEVLATILKELQAQGG